MQMQFMGGRPEDREAERAKAEAFRRRVFWLVAMGAPFLVGVLTGMLI